MNHQKQQALAISSPGSGQYGKFMSEAAIRTLTEPRDEDRRVVTQWLAENGVAHHVENELIVVSTDVAHVEALLRTEIIEVAHADLGKKLIIGGEYALPGEVSPAIAAIFGLRGLPLPQKPAIELGFPPHQKIESVTPAVLASTYSISGVSVQRGSKYAQAVAEVGMRLEPTQPAKPTSHLLSAVRLYCHPRRYSSRGST